MKVFVFVLFSVVLLQSCNYEKVLTAEKRQEIVSELLNIRAVDQRFHGLIPKELKDRHGPVKAWEIFKRKRDSVNFGHQMRIKELYNAYGYLGEKKVGEEAAQAFWLVIQHADNNVDFQQKMLKAMHEEIMYGSQDHYNYAMLEDRINVKLGKPQRFGSQLTYNERGQAIPKIGLQDSVNIDKLRSEYTLPPFKEYYNEMTQFHFEMNRQMYQDLGITKPQLY